MARYDARVRGIGKAHACSAFAGHDFEGRNIMKTPWKFLAQLASRRRSASVQENFIAPDTDPEVIESETENKSPLPFDKPTQASGTPDHDSAVDRGSMFSDQLESDPNPLQEMNLTADIQEPGTPARSETKQSDAAGKRLGPQSQTSANSQKKPEIRRRERSKNARAEGVAQSAVATNEAETVQTSSSGDTFFNEVAILDEEIKELRRLLAQKLYLQNAQLKKMLERFDAS
ncbi:hypothetical protein [Sinorhizobium fredii]|nr:hypothetical protein [Sinorhizobium fredii]